MVRLAMCMLGLALLGASCGQGPGKTGPAADPTALLDPQGKAMNEKAPDHYRAQFTTSAGVFVVEVERDLAPHGADRFYNLVRNGFYDEQRFFRVVPDFVVQWGMHKDPQVTARWEDATVPDDPVKASNKRGAVSFAATGQPHSRTTQLFVNLGDNSRLDGMGFAAFGHVVQGMDVVDKINAQYGERPDQGQIGARGNQYLQERFPELDYVQTARIAD
ncbi:MAG: peptidylprolyl isomerase [Candidatus Latescibacterota bacterium]